VTQPYGYGPPPAVRPDYPPPPPATSPGGQPLADFGSRLLAWLIDSAILGAATLVIMTPAFIAAFRSVLGPGLDEASVDNSNVSGEFLVAVLLLEAGTFVVTLVLQYIYEVELMFRSGQTVGKRVMKLRVVPIDPARRLTRRTAAVRYLIEFVLAGIVPLFALFDGLWQLWDKPYLQTVHDKVAQTVVIKVSP
jgi:uncharacterized RDD family membrane protein YckC